MKCNYKKFKIMKYLILFLGRKNCNYSLKLEKFLKNYSTNLISISSKKIGDKINYKKIKNKKIDFIICFRSFILVKKNLIKKTKIAAINFHPGTPKYRGIGCINFAIFNGEKKYGTTTHLIDEKIDHGTIINVKYFKFNKKHNLKDCLDKTHKNMFLQSKKILTQIFNNQNNLKKFIKINKHQKWSKKLFKRKDLDNLYKIKSKLSKTKIELLKRATIYKNFKPEILKLKIR